MLPPGDYSKLCQINIENRRHRGLLLYTFIAEYLYDCSCSHTEALQLERSGPRVGSLVSIPATEVTGAEVKVILVMEELQQFRLLTRVVVVVY
jgi:hypothetical protein